jgi:hypothetical protein
MDVGLCLELLRDTLCLEQKNLHGFLGWLKINGISIAKKQRRMVADMVLEETK